MGRAEKSKKVKLVALVALILPGLAFAVDTTGLKSSVNGDLVGLMGGKRLPDQAPADRDRFQARETEISFFGPIDHIWEGTVTAAAHFENGVSHFELHEGFLRSSQLVPAFDFKAGLFPLGVGRLNRVHRHDWPFTFAPKVQQEFFDKEAVADSGLEIGVLPPLPFVLNITGGVTSGFTYGHTHTAGARPLTPTHYTRVSTYADIGEATGLELGVNYLGRKSALGVQTSLYGADFITKWTEGKVTKFLFQSEVWYSKVTNPIGPKELKLGAYVFPQAGFGRWLFGVGFDTFSHLNKTNAFTNQNEKNIFYTVSPTLTYKPSEFSTFRFTYQNSTQKELSEKKWTDHSVALQMVFILGAHPAHQF